MCHVQGIQLLEMPFLRDQTVSDIIGMDTDFASIPSLRSLPCDLQHTEISASYRVFKAVMGGSGRTGGDEQDG